MADASRNLKAGFTVRQGFQDLKAGFTAQSSQNLPGAIIVRHSDSAVLLSEFHVNQFNGIPRRLKAGFDVRNCYDFSNSLGISFRWWGSGGDENVDLVLTTPTGSFVGAFGDGPAEWRWIFMPWSEFVETGIDGSRPDRSRICGILWTVHTSGIRRVDRVGMWRCAQLRAGFMVRQPSTRNLKAGFTATLVGSLNLKAGFIVAQGSGDLKAGLHILQGIEDLSGEFVIRNEETRDLKAEINVTHSRNLKAGFNVLASRSLLGHFTVRHPHARGLRASFESQGVRSLKSLFEVGQDWENLSSQFEVGQDWENLSCGFVVRHPGSSNLKAGVEVVHWENLKAGFEIRQWRADLKCGFDMPIEGNFSSWAAMWKVAKDPGESESYYYLIGVYGSYVYLINEWLYGITRRDLADGANPVVSETFLLRTTAASGNYAPWSVGRRYYALVQDVGGVPILRIFKDGDLQQSIDLSQAPTSWTTTNRWYTVSMSYDGKYIFIDCYDDLKYALFEGS